MHHDLQLILNLTIGLVAAFVFGFLATKLRFPPIVGYLLAGVAVGPYTPGFVGNAELANELAEIGVILLMFGVGVHFSLRDLLAVKGIAIPGAVVQIGVATVVGAGVALWWGWSPGAGLVLGLALSVASTVVLIRNLTEQEGLQTLHARVAVGWLIVEDLFTVFVLVLLPAVAVFLAGGPEAAAGATAGGLLLALALALGKAVIFVLLMIYVGRRAVPWLLLQVARTGSRELFILAVLALALGAAVGSAALFGVSLALGAFLAGMVISESDLSYQAAADALPMRDAFAVLFFVSVGMLFNPSFLIAEPGRVLAVLAIIMVGKAATALLIVAAAGYPLRTGLTVAAGLAQIGEFSFILAGLGRTLGLLPDEGYQLILAGSLISITLNPVLFRTIAPIETWLQGRPALLALLERRAGAMARRQFEAGGDGFRNHAIICGWGRVGSVIGQLLEQRGFPFVVIDQDRRLVESLRSRGIAAFYGDAGNEDLLAHTNVAAARIVVIAVPDPLAARHIIAFAQRLPTRPDIVARTHREQEWIYLRDRVSQAVLGEREAALEMAQFTLQRFGMSLSEVNGIVQALRGRIAMERFDAATTARSE